MLKARARCCKKNLYGIFGHVTESAQQSSQQNQNLINEDRDDNRLGWQVAQPSHGVTG